MNTPSVSYENPSLTDRVPAIVSGRGCSRESLIQAIELAVQKCAKGSFRRGSRMSGNFLFDFGQGETAVCKWESKARTELVSEMARNVGGGYSVRIFRNADNGTTLQLGKVVKG